MQLAQHPRGSAVADPGEGFGGQTPPPPQLCNLKTIADWLLQNIFFAKKKAICSCNPPPPFTKSVDPPLQCQGVEVSFSNLRQYFIGTKYPTRELVAHLSVFKCEGCCHHAKSMFGVKGHFDITKH